MKVNKPLFSIKSMKDAGYQSATAGERLSAVAQYVLSECPTFLDSCPDEVKAELTDGWAVRWQELNPAVSYNAEWVPVEKGGEVSVTLAYAMSFSQQAYGQLRNSDPQRHKVIGDVRTRFSKYCSNNMKALRTSARALLNPERQRSTTDDYAVWVEKALDNIITRCRNASARGDATADEVKTRMAVDAFRKVLAK